MEGVWALAEHSIAGYESGCTELNTTGTIVLEMRTTDECWTAHCNAVCRNSTIFVRKLKGYMQWARARHGQTGAVPANIAAVRILLPSADLLDLVMKLRAQLSLDVMRVIESFLMV